MKNHNSAIRLLNSRHLWIIVGGHGEPVEPFALPAPILRQAQDDIRSLGIKYYFPKMSNLKIKHILFFIVIFTNCLISTFAQAQVAKMPADTEFFYTYGGTNFEEARDIKETPDKGYMVVGTTSSFGQGNTSVYMIKTDSLGNHVWSAVQGGSQNDWAYAVELTPDSGFFVAGYSNSFSTSSTNNYSAYYFKTDKNGNLLWQKSIDAGNWSFIYGSCALPDSGFILCGQTYATSNGSSDGYLMRVTKNGDTLWTRHYGGIQDDILNSVCVMNNKIYAVGTNPSHPTDTVADGWIVKVDMNGNQLQETFLSYGYHQQETLNGITVYNDSLFTVCGGNNHIDSNATTPIVTKYDTSLSVNLDITTSSQLNVVYSGRFTELNKVVNISYGSICAIGTSLGGNGGTGMLFIGFNSYVGYSFINDFNPTDGGSQNEYGYSGIYTSGGKVIGVGSTQSTDEYCTNSGLGLEDMFFIRYNSDSIHKQGVIPTYNCFADTLYFSPATIEDYSANFKAILYPNPASTNTTLSITSSINEQYIAKVISVLGNEIISFKVNSNKNNSIDLSLLSEGSYVLKIQDINGQYVSALKFIVIY